MEEGRLDAREWGYEEFKYRFLVVDVMSGYILLGSHTMMLGLKTKKHEHLVYLSVLVYEKEV